MDVPLGWLTDLAVLRLGHSEVEEHGDHLVVRTPGNPTYHWGNFVLVTDPSAAADAARWLGVFETAFPTAAHRAVGLVGDPDDAAWTALGLEVERADVLVATEPLPGTAPPAGYDVRVLATGADWDASTLLRETAYPGHGDFERLATVTRAAMADRGEVTWVGAFAGDLLAAELGIVPTGAGVARYQSVLTHPEHRRRGLTTHLLGVADAHARAAGARTTVIIADQDSDPGRLYRAAGFRFDTATVQAYREPPASSAG